MTATLRNPACAAIAHEARESLVAKFNAKRASKTPPVKQEYSDDVPWRGIVKAVEEMAELTVELSKLQAFPSGVYPDHDGKQRKLLENVIEELTDVTAVLDYFREVNGIPILWSRYQEKRAKYDAWGLKGAEAGDHNA